ncbi:MULTISPECIES: phosphoserine phosphatase SerB [Kordiimonas]|jgi:phosphoserine phosphatase|uniref:phosphoserine phosphatase SerB n=1 Tax=Kordiimonas TaxID=288021 RepID=UPI00257F3C36|nr:phosphoserine phosphatase SerB [Kordiimonas sp. UBA4487]
MDIALTLVVNPDCSLSLEKIEDGIEAIKATGTPKRHTLSEGKAVDLIFEGDLNIRNQIEDALNDIDGLDWCLQPAEGRKKKMILADMDSTMITVECIDELADFIGVKGKVAAITEAAMRGELDFEAALKERVALLAGLSTDALQQCYDERIELMAGARALVQTMKANGAYAVLVSGGFTFFTEKVAAAIGFDMNRANILGIEGNALTGLVEEPICGAATKLEALNEQAAKHGLTAAEILAVGDGANDIPMIEAAGLGVAYHAKPKTREAAAAAVTYGDLTTLLYFQGYADAVFVS